MTKLSSELTKIRADRSIEEQQKDIDRYKAITDRMKVLLPMETSPAAAQQMLQDMRMAEHQSSLGMLAREHSAMLGSMQSNQNNSAAPGQQAPQEQMPQGPEAPQLEDQQAQAPQPAQAAE